MYLTNASWVALLSGKCLIVGCSREKEQSRRDGKVLLGPELVPQICLKTSGMVARTCDSNTLAAVTGRALGFAGWSANVAYLMTPGQ